jgi:hypothetical protein
MGGGFLTGLFHLYLPEISVTLNNRELISSTSQVVMDRGFISGIGSTNRKWILGVFTGLLTLREE